MISAPAASGLERADLGLDRQHRYRIRVGCAFARPPSGGARGTGYSHVDSFDRKLTVGAADQQSSS